MLLLAHQQGMKAGEVSVAEETTGAAGQLPRKKRVTRIPAHRLPGRVERLPVRKIEPVPEPVVEEPAEAEILEFPLTGAKELVRQREEAERLRKNKELAVLLLLDDLERRKMLAMLALLKK